jgi:hypothetical protein
VPDGELASHSSFGSSTPFPQPGGVVVVVVLDEVVAAVPLVDVLELVGVVVVPTGSHVQPGVQASPGGHTSAPEGELASHSSPESSTPLPQVGGVVVVVVVGVALLVDVVELAGVVVVTTGSHVQASVHSSPGPHRSAPDGELKSHSSPASTTPLPQFVGVVVVVVLVEVVEGALVVDVEVVGVVVVATGSHVQPGVHCSPAGQTRAPEGELVSHSSPASRTPLPQVGGVVVVLVVLVGVVVVEPPALHSGG